MNNNLFNFAGSELSQDAFICWLCNWINYETKKPELNLLARKFLNMMLGDKCAEYKNSLYIHRQFGDSYNKIDALLIIENKYVVIIEDKTYTSEHGDQLVRYKKLILDLSDDIKKDLHIPLGLKEEDIFAIYFKTGFHYHIDRKVKADVIIDGPAFYNLLSEYRNDSEIIDDYCNNLDNSLKWYDDIKRKLEIDHSFKDTLCHQYGQFLLLEKILPEDFREFRHGTSFGRPWTNCGIFYVDYNEEINNSSECIIFYRVDRKGNRYYISLRQYEDYYNKNIEAMVARKKEVFYILRDTFKEVAEEMPELESVIGGNNGAYKESEFGVFYIEGMNTYNNLVNNLPVFSQRFIERLKKTNLKLFIISE